MFSFKSLAILAAAILPFGNAAPTPAPQQAEVIPGRYIVTLNPGIAARDFETHLDWARDIHSRSLTRRDTTGVEKTFNISDFSAYSGAFDDATIEQIKNSPEVRLYTSSFLLRCKDIPADHPFRLPLSKPTRSGACML